MSVYLDASAILPTLIDEPASGLIAKFLLAETETLVVSEFAAAEVASGLSRLLRTRALHPKAAAARLADFDAWRATMTIDIDLQVSDIRLAGIFVRRFDLMLRAPDALHAAVCKRADCRLVTMDKRLAAAAAELGVTVQLLS